MNKLKDILVKTAWWLSVILLVGAPLHAFLSTVFLSGLGWENISVIALLLKGWKEMVIIMLLLIAVSVRVLKPKPLNALEVGIIMFIFAGLVVTLTNWHATGLGNLIWGGRTEFSFLLLLLALISLVSFWTTNQIKLLLKIALIEGVVILVGGFLLQILGHEILTKFGYRNDWSTFYLNQSPAFCQKESGTEFCRWQSSFAGPNRYAGYLLSLLPLAVFVLKSGWKRVLMILAIIISLLATLSLSAWLAAGGAFMIYYAVTNFVKIKKLLMNKWLWLASGALLVIGCFVCLPIFVQKATNAEHLIRMWQAVKAFWLEPLGAGLGVSGPASYKLGGSFIPESWFLQVLVNTGIFGLMLFLLIWVEALRKIGTNLVVNQKTDVLSKVAGVALVAVLLQNLFLHTLEDAGVYAGVMVLLAIAYASKPLKGFGD